jgi:hypothetical protein
LVLAAIVVGVLAPILIIYQLSRFHHGRSSKVQRVWVTTWLAFGWYIGLMFGSIKLNFMEQRTAIELVVMRVVYSVPAIGGMVVVGQMIKEYGDCKRL